MDVVVANVHKEELANLDIDIIKSISGEYEASEVGEMFKSFFYDRMVLDVTALKSFDNYNTYQRLVQDLDPEKIVFLLPEGSSLCTPNFLSHLISYGIYNFTTNIGGVTYLLSKPNTIKEVEHIQKMASLSPQKSDKLNDEEESKLDRSKIHTSPPTTVPHAVPTTKPAIQNHSTIIGVRNVTASAGATTLIYMMKKELSVLYGQENVIAIEIDKNDFEYFYDKTMISIKQVELENTLNKYANATIILMDLNGLRDDSFCKDIIYLIEPSTLKLNRLIRRNKMIFQNLSGKKVVLNQSILQNNDVFDFESEAGIKLFYNMPPLDERKRNSVIADFLTKLGLMNISTADSSSGKIFGLFRR